MTERALTPVNDINGSMAARQSLRAEASPTSLPTDAPALPAAAYLAQQRSIVGRRAIESDLRKIARLLGAEDWRDVDWTRLNAAAVQAVLAQLQGAPATVNRALNTLRGVARAAWQLGAISAEELGRIKAVKPVRGSRLPRGRHVEAWELAELMRVCAADKSPAGARDAAMIALAAATGMRREELTTLTLDDVTENGDGFRLRVRGKGNKEREAFITNGAAAALRDWLAVRGSIEPLGEPSGALFCRINKGGRIECTPITTTAAHKMLQKRAAEAGLRALGWHDFRRTVAGELLDAGEDLAVVARLLGHAQVTTTARYDRRPSERVRQAARKISVPYFGRA
ncbi:MAG: tyrosine-type recombinase/integrase [Anaerolineae bacterium]|nr:tyrosine-type recombinase/integrase [Candidatus Roseilinea sp.]MDW8448812.1 tyrosine-type recombinase/integrase [Anaerolineae bacterium]